MSKMSSTVIKFDPYFLKSKGKTIDALAMAHRKRIWTHVYDFSDSDHHTCCRIKSRSTIWFRCCLHWSRTLHPSSFLYLLLECSLFVISLVRRSRYPTCEITWTRRQNVSSCISNVRTSLTNKTYELSHIFYTNSKVKAVNLTKNINIIHKYRFSL